MYMVMCDVNLPVLFFVPICHVQTPAFNLVLMCARVCVYTYVHLLHHVYGVTHADPGPGSDTRASPASGRSVQHLWQTLWNTHLLCVWRSLEGSPDQRAGERWGGELRSTLI